MIEIDFSLAVALYLCAFILITVLSWVLLKRDRGKDLSLDPRFIWHCSICTYTYVNTREEHFTICPRCGSYNKK